VRSEVTRLLNNLIANRWAVVMPNGSISTSFLSHPDQILSVLQVGRHVNPTQFELTYQTYRAALAPYVSLPILYDCADDHNHQAWCGYENYRADTHEQPSRRNFPIERLEGAF